MDVDTGASVSLMSESAVVAWGSAENMQLIVVEGSRPSLLGSVVLGWTGRISTMFIAIHRYRVCFSGGVRHNEGFKTKIYVDPNTPPRFHRARSRSVPYAMGDKVEKELKRLD